MEIIKVNEFEFTPDRYDKQIADEHMWGEISLKVGNLVEKCVLQTELYGDNKGEVTFRTKPFSTLLDAGIEINFDPIIEEYKVLVEKERDKIRKYNIAKRTAEYKNLWIHSFKNVDLKKFKDVTVAITSLEDYIINTSSANVILSYKGKSVHVYFEKHNYKSSFTFYGIGSSRTKRSNDPKSLIKKFVNDVDKILEAQKIKAEEKAAIEKAANNTFNFIKSCFPDFEIGTSKHWVSNPYDRKDRGYEATAYYIVVNGLEYKISLNSKNTKENPLFNFGGFTELTSDQVIKIIEIIKK